MAKIKKNFLEEILQSKKFVKYAIIVGLLGIAAILLSEVVSSEKSTETQASQTVEMRFIEESQKAAQELIENITGDKNAKVYITLSSGMEYIYATEKTTDTGLKENKSSGQAYNNETSDKTEETYIIINTGSGEQPLLLSSVAPEIKGVAVVCNSGYDEFYSAQISKALSTLFDISEKDISISGKAS